jgi:hypothetical protein
MKASKRRERKFWSKVELIVPTGFKEAVRVAAASHYMMPAEYARRVLIEALDNDGVQIEDFNRAA